MKKGFVPKRIGRLSSQILAVLLLSAACGSAPPAQSSNGPTTSASDSLFAERTGPWSLVQVDDGGPWRVELFQASSTGSGACLAAQVGRSGSPSADPEEAISSENCKSNPQGAGRPATVESFGLRAEADGAVVAFGYASDEIEAVDIRDDLDRPVAVSRDSGTWLAVFFPTSQRYVVGFDAGTGEPLRCEFILADAPIRSLLDCDVHAESFAAER